MMATARVLVSDELWGQLGGEAGFKALPWPDGTVINGPAREVPGRRRELSICHEEIQTDEVNAVFRRDDEGKVVFVAWNPGEEVEKCQRA